jgi:hypothetical protein
VPFIFFVALSKAQCPQVKLPEGGGKINQKRRGLRAKIHFFKFFLSLST